eukprot:PhF_6_TR23255/c0_g1_i1/m.32663
MTKVVLLIHLLLWIASCNAQTPSPDPYVMSFSSNADSSWIVRPREPVTFFHMAPLPLPIVINFIIPTDTTLVNVSNVYDVVRVLDTCSELVLTGTLSVPVVNNIATFADLSVSTCRKTASSCTLVFSRLNSQQTLETGEISVTPTPAYTAQFQYPNSYLTSHTQHAVKLATPIQPVIIILVDSCGDVDNDPIFTTVITASGVALAGTVTSSTVGGVAVFTNLIVTSLAATEIAFQGPTFGVPLEANIRVVETPLLATSLRFLRTRENFVSYEDQTSRVMNSIPISDIIVELVDEVGQRDVTSQNVMITMSVSDATKETSIQGTRAIPVVLGLATFSRIVLTDCLIDPILFIFTAANAVAPPIATGNITVGPNTTKRLVVLQSSPSSMNLFSEVAGSVARVQLPRFDLRIVDSCGNVDQLATGIVSPRVCQTCGDLISGKSSSANWIKLSNGVATIEGLVLTTTMDTFTVTFVFEKITSGDTMLVVSSGVFTVERPTPSPPTLIPWGWNPAETTLPQISLSPSFYDNSGALLPYVPYAVVRVSCGLLVPYIIPSTFSSPINLTKDNLTMYVQPFSVYRSSVIKFVCVNATMFSNISTTTIFVSSEYDISKNLQLLEMEVTASTKPLYEQSTVTLSLSGASASWIFNENDRLSYHLVSSCEIGLEGYGQRTALTDYFKMGFQVTLKRTGKYHLCYWPAKYSLSKVKYIGSVDAVQYTTWIDENVVLFSILISIGGLLVLYIAYRVWQKYQLSKVVKHDPSHAFIEEALLPMKKFEPIFVPDVPESNTTNAIDVVEERSPSPMIPPSIPEDNFGRTFKSMGLEQLIPGLRKAGVTCVEDLNAVDAQPLVDAGVLNLKERVAMHQVVNAVSHSMITVKSIACTKCTNAYWDMFQTSYDSILSKPHEIVVGCGANPTEYPCSEKYFSDFCTTHFRLNRQGEKTLCVSVSGFHTFDDVSWKLFLREYVEALSVNKTVKVSTLNDPLTQYDVDELYWSQFITKYNVKDGDGVRPMIRSQPTKLHVPSKYDKL